MGADLGVAVPLVDGRVTSEKIIVALAVDVPHEHALPSFQDDRDRVVVVGSVGIFSGNVLYTENDVCLLVVCAASAYLLLQ